VLLGCAGRELLSPPRPDLPLRPLSQVVPRIATPQATAPASSASSVAAASADVDAGVPAPEPAPIEAPVPVPVPVTGARCASVPPLLPNGAVPPAPPHAPLGEDVSVPGDRPAYVLPGNLGDPRVIVYLHGMCGDTTAADYFREAVRAHGTLIAVRGDTACDNGRFKWRDEPSKIQARVRRAFASVNARLGGGLTLDGALLFGYSQGADRAEKLAAQYPQKYPRLVLGGPPMKASPIKLARAERVAILGGELETTENMRIGYDQLVAAGIPARFFTLECAYHGYFGTRAELQLAEVLDWVTQP
jgi:hypothetical protein